MRDHARCCSGRSGACDQGLYRIHHGCPAAECDRRTHALRRKIRRPGVDGQAVIKWYGLARDPLVGRPSFWPLILMSDVRSGYPLAVIEGSWITGMRTAALT